MSGAPSIQTLEQAAVAALEALEALPVGEPYQAPLLAATEAIDELEAAAGEMLSPGIEPIGRDVLADLEHFTSGVRRATFGAELAAIHRAALETHPKLARVLRSSELIQRVADAADQPNMPPDTPVRAQERYLRMLATDLRGRNEFEPAATVLADTLPTLQQRIAAAEATHQAHAAAELARLEHERQAAEQALVDQRRARARALADTLARFRQMEVYFSWQPPGYLTAEQLTVPRVLDLLRASDVSDAFLASIERQAAPFLAPR